MSSVGIERISFYTSRYYLDLALLAEKRGIDPNKYLQGLGQEKMAVLPPNEDVVTLAATSAKQALDGIDTASIAMVLIATESGIDQSKALGIWVHHLLSLPKSCRVVELKQACYAGCASLQLALSFIHTHPDKKVLLIATDVAKYGLNTPGEPTQGCGACAMLLSSNATICSIEPEYGAYTSHVMDFWRPNYREEALVDGKYSTRIYLNALEECWNEYQLASKRTFNDHARYCYHIPFSRMAEKAHERLCKLSIGTNFPEAISDSLIYSRTLGNSYTASLFIGLASLLEQASGDLSEKRIGLFSYGSGCVAEFFSAKVSTGYQKYLKKELHEELLAKRCALNVSEYEAFYQFRLPQDGSEYQVNPHQCGAFCLTGIKNHERLYSKSTMP